MIAVIWSDLVAWQSKWSRRTLCVAITVVALAGGTAMLRPEICAVAAILAAVWIGLLAGRQTWSEVRSWDWVRRGGLGPERVVAAKLIAAALVAAAHMLALLPAAVLMASLWGLPWSILGRVASIAICASVTAAAFGSIGSHLNFEDDDEYLGSFLAVLWLTVTAVVAPFRMVNPMLRAWAIVAPSGPEHPLGLLGLAVTALGIAAVASIVLRWEVHKAR